MPYCRAASRRPGSIDELDACFIVKGSNGQKLAYVYFEDLPGRSKLYSAPI
jgi:hypothetical protein